MTPAGTTGPCPEPGPKCGEDRLVTLVADPELIPLGSDIRTARKGLKKTAGEFTKLDKPAQRLPPNA